MDVYDVNSASKPLNGAEINKCYNTFTEGKMSQQGSIGDCWIPDALHVIQQQCQSIVRNIFHKGCSTLMHNELYCVIRHSADNQQHWQHTELRKGGSSCWRRRPIITLYWSHVTLVQQLCIWQFRQLNCFLGLDRFVRFSASVCVS